MRIVILGAILLMFRLPAFADEFTIFSNIDPGIYATATNDALENFNFDSDYENASTETDVLTQATPESGYTIEDFLQQNGITTE